MPADRKCLDDIEVRSADDVQRSVDAAVKLLDSLECSSLIGTLAPCRADTGGSALPACCLLAREFQSVEFLVHQSWQSLIKRLGVADVQQRLTLVVACLLLSSEPRRGLHCNNRHATSRRRERVSPRNQRQATTGCVWVDEDDKSRSRWHWKRVCRDSDPMKDGLWSIYISSVLTPHQPQRSLRSVNQNYHAVTAVLDKERRFSHCAPKIWSDIPVRHSTALSAT